jgi:uncharacterized protein YeaO (DUF488 family)
MNDITVERVYDWRREPEGSGAVFLVDRLWPRGVSAEDVEGVDWVADAAPSPQLRIWFGHTPERFEQFAARYRSELDAHPERADAVLDAARSGPVTLLYAAKDPEVNHAVVLRDWVKERLES